MPAYITIKSGDSLERIECKELVTVGRDGSNSMPVFDSEMSRNHAMVRRLGRDQYYLFDTGSRNGSFVNGLRVSSPTLLKSGDVLNLGNTTFVFEQFSAPNADFRPATEVMAETIRSDVTSIMKIVVLVADIRGYTRLSEQLPIKVLSNLMSEWFDQVHKIVERNGGRVDKFIGDCVMAVWDVGEDPAPGANSCIKAAYEIYMYTGDMHLKFQDLPAPLRIGVGINTGEAAVGIGSDNTAMGDTVNLAFRLETATKSLNCDMVLSQSTYELLPPRLWRGKETDIVVKGRKGSVRVCSLHFAKGKSPLTHN